MSPERFIDSASVDESSMYAQRTIRPGRVRRVSLTEIPYSTGVFFVLAYAARAFAPAAALRRSVSNARSRRSLPSFRRRFPRIYNSPGKAYVPAYARIFSPAPSCQPRDTAPRRRGRGRPPTFRPDSGRACPGHIETGVDLPRRGTVVPFSTEKLRGTRGAPRRRRTRGLYHRHARIFRPRFRRHAGHADSPTGNGTPR